MPPRHFVGLLSEFERAAQVLISLKLGMRPVIWFKGLLPWRNVYQGLTFFTSLRVPSVASKISLSVSCYSLSPPELHHWEEGVIPGLRRVRRKSLGHLRLSCRC